MSHRRPADLSLEELASLTSGSATWLSTAVDDFVPAIVLSDGPHGLRRQADNGDNLGIGNSIPAVCFPPAVGLSATWNRDLIRRVGAELGREASALNTQVLLGPGLNIKRSPLGGRNFEYFSEDPHLTGQLAGAMVEGIQSQGVAATPKHFAVNNQESDRMRVSAELSERALREIYLSAFEHVVKTVQPWALMSAYNRVNGEFASESYRLLTEILRDEWGFDGLVMSDWGAVVDRAAAVAAGLDLEMPPSRTDERIIAAVEAGELDPAVLQVVAERVQTLVARTAGERLERDIDAAQAVALEAAREAVTLLSNDGLLPLADDKRVLVVGEFARTPRFQGGGSSRVVPTRIVSALDSLVELAGADRVSFEPGFLTGRTDDTALADAAVAAATTADVIVAFLGLPDHIESEGFDRADLHLPATQTAVLERLISTGKPVVVVLANGSVIDATAWKDRVGAIVEGWLLGQEGGRAIAEVLLGITNPSGRLTETMPLALEHTPAYLTFPGQDGIVTYGEDIFVGYRGFDARGTDVAFPFGHGLSYTTFAYEDLEVEATDDGWNISVTIRNTGERDGSETVQVYVGAVGSVVPRAVRELRGFDKVAVAAGTATRVTIPLANADLARWNTRANRWSVDAGDYVISVGASSRDLRLSATVTSAGDGIVDPLREDSTVSEWMAHRVTREFVEGLRAKMPAESLERAPEVAAMFAELPVMKLTTFGFGITEQGVRDLIAQANAELTAA